MNIQYEYDEFADVLYASYGVPKSAISEEPFDGIIIRRDPATYEIIGFTILNYRRQKEQGYLENNPYFDFREIPF